MKPFTLLALALLVAISHAAPDFRSIGTLPGGSASGALAVSADGNWVTGLTESTEGLQMFRWSQPYGMQGLGDIPVGQFSSVGYGISGNGRVAAGLGTLEGYQSAMRWSVTDGITDLGNLSQLPYFFSVANAVSADGTTVIGTSDREIAIEAYRWTEQTGMVGLGFFPGDVVYHSEAWACSADGSTVVGWSELSTGAMAFYWRDFGGMHPVGYLPGGSFSVAYGVSDDGNKIVGQAQTEFGESAFFFNGAISKLTDLSGGDNSSANGISGDGTVIVGQTGTPSGNKAFIYKNGLMRLVTDVMSQDFGVSTGGWNLDNATGVSRDGTVVVGTGTYLGAQRGWVARMPKAGTVESTVTLQSFTGDAELQVLTVEIRAVGSTTVLESHPIPPDSLGIARFVTNLRGNYDLAIKGSHWLRSVQPITITNGSVAASYTLVNGDVDGDNEVAIGDYALLSLAFGSLEGDGNWNPNADLDGDGEVAIGDYAILSASFGSIGED